MSTPISTTQTTYSYGTAKGWRIFIYLFAPLLVLLFLSAPFWLGDEGWNTGLALLAAAFWAFGLFFVFAAYETYKGRHIFSDQSIVYAGALRRKEIPLAGVKGYRTDDKYIHIIPNSKQYPGIRIGYTSEGYEQIQQWLADRFPDLDIQQQQQEAEALRQEVEFGRDELEREANLARARQVSRVLNIAGWLVGGWLFFFPKP